MIFRRLVICLDWLWRRLRRVRPVDSLLSLSLKSYRGDPGKLPRGIALKRGDLLAILHLNHDCLADMDAAGNTNLRGALRFRRRLIDSLQRIAQRLQNDPQLGRVKAVYGVTWFRPHGERLGFIVEPLPDNWMTRLRILPFRVLLQALFPALARREYGRLHPHAFWLSRQELLTRFGHPRAKRP